MLMVPALPAAAAVEEYLSEKYRSQLHRPQPVSRPCIPYSLTVPALTAAAAAAEHPQIHGRLPKQQQQHKQQFGCCDPGWRRWRRGTQRRRRSQQQVGGNVGQGHDSLQLPRLRVDDYKPPHRCGRQPARRISASPEAASTLKTAQQRRAEVRQLTSLMHVSDVW